MKHRHEVKFRVVYDTVTTIKCDVCKKCMSESEKCIPESELPSDWFEFTTHHNHWGNNSCESHYEFQVCGPECYKKKFIEIVNGYEEDKYNDSEVSGMKYEFAIAFRDMLIGTDEEGES